MISVIWFNTIYDHDAFTLTLASVCRFIVQYMIGLK